MRAVLQRVRSAHVTVARVVRGCIGPGWVVFLGIEEADAAEDGEWLSRKVVELRIFDLGFGSPNSEVERAGPERVPSPHQFSVREIGGEILLISQFTLHASTRKGTRPSWHRAAKAASAVPLYEAFHRRLEQLLERPVPTGVFGAEMEVALINDGPVTLLLDSKLRE